LFRSDRERHCTLQWSYGEPSTVEGTIMVNRKQHALRIKRIYEAPAADDGTRILVDRLWPRGVRKENAALDAWIKNAAPSPDLRKWFNHDPERFEEFASRYRAELKHNAALDEIRALLKENTVTLLYAAHDPDCNHALVLADYLREHG
jgi:uncharacterized protein YeaO (DUF488 family)